MRHDDESTYDDLRDLLGLLRDDAPVVELIDDIGAERGWWPVGRSWRREYGRLDLGNDPPVTLLFESPAADGEPQELCTVDVRTGPPGVGDVPLLGMGSARLRRFPADDAMPWLADVLALHRAPTVLRYRPAKRCTLRAERVDGTRVFVKVFDDSIDGAAMHAEALAITAASAAGELGFAVAPSLGWEAGLHAFTQGTVPGEPAVLVLFGPDGPALAARMGAAAATLTTSSLLPAGRAGRERQMKRSTKYASRIAAAFPAMRPSLDDLLARLEELHAGDTPDRLRPIHGAPHPHQWLLDGDGGLGLVDFDGFALGPPELDVATFVAEMEYENPDRMPVTAIIDGFRAGYEHVAGPLDDSVLRAYVAHKRLAKAQRNARSVRDDNDVRVAATVAEALDLVDR